MWLLSSVKIKSSNWKLPMPSWLKDFLTGVGTAFVRMSGWHLSEVLDLFWQFRINTFDIGHNLEKMSSFLLGFCSLQVKFFSNIFFHHHHKNISIKIAPIVAKYMLITVANVTTVGTGAQNRPLLKSFTFWKQQSPSNL